MGTGAFKLTQRTVEAAKCPPGRKDRLLFDSELRGFGLRVTAAGSRTFLARSSTPAGKRRVALGAFGVLTVEEARKRAKSVLGIAADGRDPFVERKAKAAAAQKAKAEAEYSFSALVAEWAKAREGDRRHSYLREAVAASSANYRCGSTAQPAALLFPTLCEPWIASRPKRVQWLPTERSPTPAPPMAGQSSGSTWL